MTDIVPTAAALRKCRRSSIMCVLSVATIRAGGRLHRRRHRAEATVYRGQWYRSARRESGRANPPLSRRRSLVALEVLAQPVHHLGGVEPDVAAERAAADVL